MSAKASFIKQQSRACARCGFAFPVDKARCPSCKSWNITSVKNQGPVRALSDDDDDGTCLLSEVTTDALKRRLITGPWDECFGGGIVDKSVTLLGGAPGAGKSTMSLQLADSIAYSTQGEVFYVAAEEAKDDVNDRAKRLNLRKRNGIRVYPLGCTSDLGATIIKRKPKAIILDSLPGLVGEDKQAAVELCTNLKGYAVSLDAPVIVIDHVTKEEEFAGLMTLQHAVDTTMTLFPIELDAELAEELDLESIIETLNIDVKELDIRELNTIKNRNGKAHISVYFTMTPTGLVHVPTKANFRIDEDDDA